MDKISKAIVEKMWVDAKDMFFKNYFKDIVESFNKGIEDLRTISENFNKIYSEENENQT